MLNDKETKLLSFLRFRNATWLALNPVPRCLIICLKLQHGVWISPSEAWGTERSGWSSCIWHGGVLSSGYWQSPPVRLSQYSPSGLALCYVLHWFVQRAECDRSVLSLGYWTDYTGFKSWQGKTFPSLQNGDGTHAAFRSMGTGVTEAGSWIWPLTCI